MTRSPLRCCTSIIWSSALVQASSSLSIGRACAWPRRLPVTEMHFRHFSREFLISPFCRSPHLWLVVLFWWFVYFSNLNPFQTFNNHCVIWCFNTWFSMVLRHVPHQFYDNRTKTFVVLAGVDLAVSTKSICVVQSNINCVIAVSNPPQKKLPRRSWCRVTWKVSR